jgi:hypothetical protein
VVVKIEMSMLGIRSGEELLFHYYIPPIKGNLETKKLYTQRLEFSDYRLDIDINGIEIPFLKLFELFPFSSNSKKKGLFHLRGCSCIGLTFEVPGFEFLRFPGPRTYSNYGVCECTSQIFVHPGYTFFEFDHTYKVKEEEDKNKKVNTELLTEKKSLKNKVTFEKQKTNNSKKASFRRNYSLFRCFDMRS